MTEKVSMNSLSINYKEFFKNEKKKVTKNYAKML